MKVDSSLMKIARRCRRCGPHGRCLYHRTPRQRAELRRWLAVTTLEAS